jgi:tRNA (adenine37-N6)-methyltransferase
MLRKIEFKPIGIIHSPFKTMDNMPVQNVGAKGEKGTIEIFPEFAEGLKDLDGFSHLILLYHFHLVNHVSLTVVPFLDTTEHGIFATRAPVRPNPVGLTVAKLIEIKGNLLSIEDLDMLDQTPLIDIKPCLPMIDNIQDIQIGWLSGKIENFEIEKSDDRFIKNMKY